MPCFIFLKFSLRSPPVIVAMRRDGCEVRAFGLFLPRLGPSVGRPDSCVVCPPQRAKATLDDCPIAVIRVVVQCNSPTLRCSMGGKPQSWAEAVGKGSPPVGRFAPRDFSASLVELGVLAGLVF